MAEESPVDSVEECCKICRFWHEDVRYTYDEEPKDEDNSYISQCRRYPPVSPVGHAYAYEEPEPDSPHFPLTRDFDWCGEFEPKEEQQ